MHTFMEESLIIVPVAFASAHAYDCEDFITAFLAHYSKVESSIRVRVVHQTLFSESHMFS